jgi:outer membrane protein assembly factor BamB
MNNSSHRDMTASSAGKPPRVAAATGDTTTDALDPDARTSQLVEILDKYVEDLALGRAPRREQLLAAHPELAGQLDACLSGVEFIHGASAASGGAPKRLGDFLIRHEIGRGGMGAVYEAEQLSLGRKVALKVLRFGAVSDSEAVERFKREAETVADLHHTNIVPIFSVGCESGVNYYAMQFIEGRSLDQVPQGDEQLDPAIVADWGLQAAEALTHAHQRDVIHRDVKPSNLLLDGEGRIWLTDFGLAKRLDDVTLSMTGALLGTPRYMSPEQAQTAIKAVDHRTDIYSLGATLYELVTGEPVFAANTPHGVIDQILHSEPLPPRQHRPDLPRDLETVLLKCLSKDASQRYATARELADDLRAVVEERPILARRPRAVERATRWLKKRQRSLLPAVAISLGTLLAVGLVAAGRHVYQRWQSATLMIATQQPGLVAELTRENAVPLLQVLPTPQPIEVAAGEIALNLSGKGKLSQRYEMRLSAGQRGSVDLTTDDQRIGRAVPIERSFRLIPFSDGVDPILLDDKQIRRWDAERDVAVWTLDMTQASGPLLPGVSKIQWPWRVNRAGFSTHDKLDQQPFLLGQLEMNGDIDRPREVIDSAVDLDQDGEVDIVVASREEAWLLAISGRTGAVLWLATRGEDVGKELSTPRFSQAVRSATLSPPLSAGDLNDDGIPDLIATFGDVGSLNFRIAGPDQLRATEWIEAVSGKSGETLWRSQIDSDWLEPTAKDKAPYAFRWFVGLSPGSSARVSSASSKRGDIRWRSRDREYIRTGRYSVIPDSPRLVTLDPAVGSIHSEPERPDGQAQRRSVVVVAGTHVVQLDPRTGTQLADPQQTGVLAGKPARYADMDGDGVVDIVLLEERPPKTRDEVYGMVAEVPQVRIAVWSLAKDMLLWQQDFTAHWPRKMDADVVSPEWPLVSDLDGDGACELLLPDGTTNVGIHSPRPKAPAGQLAVIEGATGRRRWQRRLFTMDQQIDHFVAGPDIDGDGTRDVFVASLWGEQFDLFIDALSGADGRTLWRTRHPLNRGREGSPIDHRIGQLSWWNGGNDGWPQLAASVHTRIRSESEHAVCLFSAGTGQLRQIAEGAQAVWSGDVNRDGVGDLCSFQPPTESVRRHGEMSLYCGVAAEYWRRLGDLRFPICDVDGDGIRDLLRPIGPNRLEASSGYSGNPLWTTALAVAETGRFEVLSQRGQAVAGMLSRNQLRQRDLDRDGTPDLLIGLHTLERTAFSPLHAISGRTGKPLWQCGFKINVCWGSAMAEFVDLDGDDRAEVVYVGAMNLDYPESKSLSLNEQQLWLVVLSAEDGSVKWKLPLSPAYGQTPQINRHRLRVDMLRIESAAVDLNADGILDLIVPAEVGTDQPPLADQAVELIAVSGIDGSRLWSHPLPSTRNAVGRLLEVPPVVATDLDGDGSREVITLEFEDIDKPTTRRLAFLRALEASTGRLRWQWQGEVDASYGEVDNLQEVDSRPRPVILQTKSGRPRIGVVLRRNSPSESPFMGHIIDHDGHSIGKIPLVASEGYYRDTHRFYPHDTNGDGNDELIFWNRQAIVAASAGSPADTLWQKPLATRLQAHLVGLLPGSLGATPRPTVAVLRQGSGDNSLIGVDVASGDVQWKCAGPTARAGQGWIAADRVELLGRMNDIPPIAYFLFGNVSVCRQSAVVNETGGISQEVAQAVRSPATIGGISEDVRHLRDLPWRIRPDDPDVRQMIRIGKSSVFYCLTLILVPGAILMSLVRRRRFDSLAVISAVAGCFSIGIGLNFGDAEGDTHMRIERLVLAVAQLPVIQFLFEPIREIGRGRWRRAIAWFGVTMIVSIALAVIILLYYGSYSDFAIQPDEQYSMHGWYTIGLWGAYLTGVMMLAVAAGRRVVGFIRSRRIKPTPDSLLRGPIAE